MENNKTYRLKENLIGSKIADIFEWNGSYYFNQRLPLIFFSKEFVEGTGSFFEKINQ